MNTQDQTSTFEPKNSEVSNWLFSLGLMVLIMVLIGGITRLTGSGLSMVEWRPLMGFLPPISNEEWIRVFSLYQKSPEFIEINNAITLSDFKKIFWWEYIHRLWGRLIGLAFIIPFLWFLFKGLINRSLAPRLVLLFILGGAQGVLGWYMVKSGLVDEPEVSQYMLAAHLAFALLLYLGLIWTALELRYPKSKNGKSYQISKSLNTLSALLFVFVFITIFSGALVAGTDAGFYFNTFPLMEGSIVPENYLPQPWYVSTFEDIGTVQFHHRIIAIITFIIAIITWWHSRWIAIKKRARMAANILIIVALLQVTLGISTLVMGVPVALAVLHQTFAVLLLTASIWFVFELR